MRLQALDELRAYNKVMKALPETESDYMKKLGRAKQKIGGRYDLFEYIIMMSAASGRDRAFLLDQDPLFIVRNFIGRSLHGT